MSKFDFTLLKTVRPGKLMTCIGISLLAHIVSLYAYGMFGRFDFGAPVNLTSAISVDLKDPPRQHESVKEDKDEHNETPADDDDMRLDAEQRTALTDAEKQIPGSAPSVMPLPDNESNQPATAASLPPTASIESKPRHPTKFELLPPLRSSEEFMGTESETLSYRISLLGIPVGSAILHARRDKGEVWLTLKVTSDAVISNIYPVDDLIETRHINGNFIVTRIRQKEGSFTGDRGFTLFLRDKNVFWIDRLTRKSVREEIPNSEVVDILSGLYYLRNRQLQVGKSETVHIYDSDTYAAVPVDVLQRETIRLPDLSEVNSLIIQPKLKTDGIFKRTGDIRIWLSDDEYRVPVKIVTSIALGRVTAELVSAESKRSEKYGAQK
jgi:uncharacterized protein DUF3108